MVTSADWAALPSPDLPDAGLPPKRTSVRTWWCLAASSVALTAAVVVGTWAVTQHNEGVRGADCVVVQAGSPGEELRATRTPCGTDPSFTVAKRGHSAADCVPGRYAQFRPPFADQ